MTEPRIQFKKLKGFPAVDGGKLETEAFLEASKEIVSVIETFGKLFTPVISDMNGNIVKLSKSYEKDKKAFHYLEDLIVLTLREKDKFAADALLWLKRGLQLICTFFENIINDKQQADFLKKHLQDAYEKTLKQYHGFIVQATIKLIYSWVPTRAQLIGSGESHEENISILQSYLPTMRTHLTSIDILLKQYNIDCQSKNL